MIRGRAGLSTPRSPESSEGGQRLVYGRDSAADRVAARTEILEAGEGLSTLRDEAVPYGEETRPKSEPRR